MNVTPSSSMLRGCNTQPKTLNPNPPATAGPHHTHLVPSRQKVPELFVVYFEELCLDHEGRGAWRSCNGIKQLPAQRTAASVQRGVVKWRLLCCSAGRGVERVKGPPRRPAQLMPRSADCCAGPCSTQSPTFCYTCSCSSTHLITRGMMPRCSAMVCSALPMPIVCVWPSQPQHSSMQRQGQTR